MLDVHQTVVLDILFPLGWTALENPPKIECDSGKDVDWGGFGFGVTTQGGSANASRTISIDVAACLWTPNCLASVKGPQIHNQSVDTVLTLYPILRSKVECCFHIQLCMTVIAMFAETQSDYRFAVRTIAMCLQTPNCPTGVKGPQILNQSMYPWKCFFFFFKIQLRVLLHHL